MNNKYYLLISLLLTVFNSNQLFAKTTLIKNIKGYTLNGDSLHKFTAIKFTNDKIDALYQADQAIKVAKDTLVIDGNGQTMLPGLIDAHGHVLSYGLRLTQVDLMNSVSEAAAVEKTQAYAKKNPDNTWIKGGGWNQVQWSNNQFPSAQSLDKVFPNTPVWLARVDGHAGWANSKAMALAGINKHTKSPEGGEIIRHKNGQPSGIFIDNAMALIDSIIPVQTLQQQQNTLRKSLLSLASLGLTSVHDAGIDKTNMAAFKALARENKMPIRINAMLYLPSPEWQAVLKTGSYSSTDDMFAFNSVKIQADGALGSRGAALINEYSDHPGHTGLLLHDEASLIHYINTAMKAGFQVNTHAIGDNANKQVLDIYQDQIEKTNSRHLRHRIEHAQVLRLIDIPRFAQNNIIASMQATHATSDKNMALTRLGPERINGAYAWRKLLNAGTIIAAGSDFPVESPNPFYGLHASVTRQDKTNQPQGGWYKSQKMTRVEALRTFTVDAAYAGHQEQIIGSLEPGKKADFILVADDYITVKESQLWQNTVNQTWVNGKNVFSK
jgi:hypothetical protein